MDDERWNEKMEEVIESENVYIGKYIYIDI